MTDNEDQEVTLQSKAANPFNQWSDWYGTEGEAVVTFYTMKEELWSKWSNQAVSIEHNDCDHDDMEEKINCDDTERVVDHDAFDAGEVREPGIYLDDTHYDDEEKVAESYTIIAPFDFLSPKLCRDWIQKLNDKYDRRFQLSIAEEQQVNASPVDEVMGANRLRVSEDSKTKSGEDPE